MIVLLGWNTYRRFLDWASLDDVNISSCYIDREKKKGHGVRMEDNDFYFSTKVAEREVWTGEKVPKWVVDIGGEGPKSNELRPLEMVADEIGGAFQRFVSQLKVPA